VPNIDDALALFVDTLGFGLVHRAPAANISAESAVLDCGSVVLTLIQPVESDGPAFPDPTSRLSQLIVEVDDADAASATVAQAGLSVQVVDESNSFVTPAAMEGVVGFPMALVLRSAKAIEGLDNSEDAETE